MQIHTGGVSSSSSSSSSSKPVTPVLSGEICKPKTAPLFTANTNTSTGKQSGNNIPSVSSNATVTKLSETHQLLQQRGEKLSEVSDKSKQMSDQSKEFANMAKQLRQKQTSWF